MTLPVLRPEPGTVARGWLDIEDEGRPVGTPADDPAGRSDEKESRHGSVSGRPHDCGGPFPADGLSSETLTDRVPV